MRWSLAWIIGLALSFTAVGCRSCDRVESTLRARERELRETREELERTRAYTNGLQIELNAERGVPPPICGDPFVTAYPIRSLVLGRQTGGREDNYGSGDQALQVVVEPHDAEDQAVKVPGSLVIQVLEITPEGVKQPLSSWDISGEQLRRSWRSGLLSTGYMLVLPWKTCPTTEKLRVVAQFKLPDGRTFEADKDITIHVPPPSERRVLPPEPVPIPAASEQILPLPHRVEPPAISGPNITQKDGGGIQPVRVEKPVSGTNVADDGGQPVWRVVEPR